MLDRPARILAAADVYQALTEDRPHRPAFEPFRAAQLIRELPLDRDAVEAVLAAAVIAGARRAGPTPAA